MKKKRMISTRYLLTWKIIWRQDPLMPCPVICCAIMAKKVIILLDEYDTPMQEANVHGYWDETVEFMRNLFNATFKTNPYLDRAIMTGITRVSKESI